MNTETLRKTIVEKLNNYDQLKESKEKQDREWAKLIKAYIAEVEGTGYDELIRLRYQERLEVNDILSILFIERTTFYQWEREIIWNIALEAAYRRLLVLN